VKKVAVFGNAGGGKSTLSLKLSELSGLPLHILDKIQFRPGGEPVPPQDFKHAHDIILAGDRWIIDGYGSLDTLWPRLNAADTLIYLDLPLPVHFGWVTKRLITGRFKPPEGWPENSPIWRSSLSSYRALWLCHKFLTPQYREFVTQAKRDKNVHHIRTTGEIPQFLASIEEASRPGRDIGRDARDG
jgi:adenylate kinase family enzyme